nr:glutamate--cysteine ligase regulatory subunit [Danaus plexippus plexippus]
MLKSASKVTINTGNVLNLIDIKKKAGQNVTEELSESIKLTLSEWGTQNGHSLPNGSIANTSTQANLVLLSTDSKTVLNITRPHDDVQNKMAEEERKNLKIGVKIFINEDSTADLRECLDSAASCIFSARISSNEMEADNEADARKCEAILPGIKILWAVLEDYVKEGRVLQLGVADVGGGCLRKLHAWARVKPAIAQINLASCCVVPPALHAFCKANDVQLLTHADPPDLLTVAAIKAVSEAGGCETLDWCARYQVHIKCRGVLALKGYVCKATIDNKKK